MYYDDELPAGYQDADLEARELASASGYRPCDGCDEAEVDPDLARPGEDFVLCDDCRDRMERAA